MSKENNRILSRFMNNFERYLISLIIVNIIVLAAFQIILTQENLRVLVSKTDVVETIGKSSDVSGLSGGVLEQNEIQSEHLTLELDYSIALPKLKILINGMDIADFSNKKVMVRVKNGDLIEIDGRFYPYTVGIRVISSSPIITSPKIGDKIFVNGTIESLGRINIQGGELENHEAVGYNGTSTGNI